MSYDGKLISAREAVPATSQHTKPCSDCPWRRDALPGWLGSETADAWVQLAHGEGNAECHALTGVQCAGLAIYRANVAKKPRDRRVLQLPSDRGRVFASPREFLDHHGKMPAMPDLSDVPTLSEALKIRPQAGEDEIGFAYQDSKIRSFEISSGLTRRQLVFGLLNQRGFAKPGSFKLLRTWDGKRWVKPAMT